MKDRVGLGFRPQLAAGILAHLDRIDLVEVLAEDWIELPRGRRRALKTLARMLPLWIHGTGLGLAACEAVATTRLDALARLVGEVEPEGWSEHLAFVRSGGVEIGHLAAPPRSLDTLAGTAANFTRAHRTVGQAPLLENVASLLDPPCSEMGEGEWMIRVLGETGGRLLLDLHNLHANAVNFAFDASALIASLPLERVGLVHVAGGRWIGGLGPGAGRRLLDDHLHPVPEPVFELLEQVAERAPGPLSVVLERDGRYPPMLELLAELDRVRATLARGRARGLAAAS